LMVGTDVSTQGGISAVVRGYRGAGLFERFDSVYVATHRDGGAATKARTALAAWARTLVLLVRLPAPLVHIHLSSRASFWRKSVVCLMAMAAGRPYVLHMHGSEFMKFYDTECGPLRRRFVRFVFGRAASLLALSEQWRNDLLRISPSSSVEVLPNAVELPATGLRGTPDARTPKDAARLLFLGRLGERKGTFDLVRAFARIGGRYPRAVLTCAGDGAVEEVGALARELGLGERVMCPGWLSVEQARGALAGAQIFVLPSYAEGVPMALLEAMARGLAIVTTPVGGIPAVIESERDGLLVPPGDIEALADALSRLLADEELRARLGRAARERIAREFSLDASIERLAALYRRFGLVDRAAAPAGPQPNSDASANARIS
jgi:glycosyltransferase involved in cell wall biosynthesis